ncbi:hypothetical protein Acr_05g0010610 [Actinidia rufa]|uniref:CCHC-type domain-containing protein n=1 Tax=Actinidia rufa TaxID=165716 RepID=A0A7J0EM90_9ERIC|nr:hypothetical protein Acr_05g0010610 [Actinidia rufa]
MPSHQARGRARSLMRARGACAAHGARRNRDQGDNDNHHESAIEGEANAFGENVWVVGVQEMLVPARAVDTRAVIREGVNETRRITHLKSQREGTSEQSKGHFSKEPKSSMLLDQTSHGGPIYFGCHQSGHRVASCPLKGQKRQSRQGGYSRGLAQEQLQVRKPPTYFHCSQVGHIARQCTQRRNTQGALGQKGKRTQGQTDSVTSAVGPLEIAGQQEQ